MTVNYKLAIKKPKHGIFFNLLNNKKKSTMSFNIVIFIKKLLVVINTFLNEIRYLYVIWAFQDHTEVMKTVMIFNLTGSCFIQLAVFAIQASDLKDQVHN